MAISGTTILWAFLAVIHRWHAYSAVTRFEAMSFLSLLVVTPIFEIWAEERGRNGFGRFGSSINGYVLTLLAIRAFH